MARTVEEINDYLVTQLTAELAAAGITITPATWSKRNLLRAITYANAICQATAEQLQDQYITEITDIQNKSASATAPWIQDKMFKFQYSATTPQVVQLNTTTLSYEYDTIVDALKIITACSVRSTIANQVLIKCAKGTTLGALSVGELAAAQTYIDTIGTAGIVYTVQSDNPDKLFIDADIYYDAAYAAVISTTVIDAINAYLTDLSLTKFDGSLLVSDLERMIRNIDGVNDVVLQNVAARYDSQAFGSGIDLVLNGDWQNRKYLTGAGYIVEEDTAGQTFADSLNFIPE